MELVYGWRLIAPIDLVTLIPLAIRIVQIQDNEASYQLLTDAWCTPMVAARQFRRGVYKAGNQSKRQHQQRRW